MGADGACPIVRLRVRGRDDTRRWEPGAAASDVGVVRVVGFRLPDPIIVVVGFQQVGLLHQAVD